MNFTVYKSSAGSGKTFTLVKEYLKITLNKPYKFRNILAITFTNKAANEMKDRIITNLRDISSATPDKNSPAIKFLLPELVKETGLTPEIITQRANKVLELILHNYADFSICTIDSFVHRIIRTFAHDLNLPINFEVELDANILIEQTIDYLISEAGKNEKLTKALIKFTETKAEDEKSWHIEKDLKDFAETLMKEDGQIYLEKLRKLNLQDFFNIIKKVNEFIKSTEQALVKQAQNATNKIKGTNLPISAFYRGRSGIVKYFEYITDYRFDKLSPNSFVETTINENKWYGSKTDKDDKIIIDGIKDNLIEIYNNIQDVLAENYEEYNLFLLLKRKLYPMAVLNEIEKILVKIKSENNIVHISEFNRRIADIVLNEPVPFIYERLGERYNHFLLDEFQDTSVLQWQNLLPLLHNSLAEGNFNMIVGDGKQAIYRWRSGEVEQFDNLPKIHKKNSTIIDTERENSLIRNYIGKNLKSNFRSKTEIVDFNNKFFTEIAELIPSLYQSIYKNLVQDSDPDNVGGTIQIDFLNNKNINSTFEELNFEKIKDIINNLSEDNYDLKDIAILCRSNKNASNIARYLINENFDVISSESLLLSSSHKINCIHSTLKYLFNTSDNIARNSIVAFLVNSKRISAADMNINFLLANKQTTPKSNFDSGISNTGVFQDFLNKSGFNISVNELTKLPLYDLCEEIIRIFKLNDEVDPYIQFFLDAVHMFSITKSSTASDFIEWWEENKNKLSIIVPEGVNAIRILTIHKSKGLEFPVVIFPFANDRITNTKSELWVDLNNSRVPELKTALLSVNKKMEETIYADLYQEEKEKSFLDAINLLYVVMTRPVEKLYIITSNPASNPDTINSYPLIFKHYLQSIKEWSDEKHSYQFGQKKQKESLKDEISEQVCSLDSFISNPWKNKILLSTRAPELWDVDDPERNSEWGNLVHTALSKIITLDDRKRSIEDMFSRGLINKEEKVKLEEKIDKLLSHPAIRTFFRKGQDIKTEAEILLPDGRSFRPDRLVFDKDKVTIIDYKTGKPEHYHNKQINLYGRLLQDMGYQKIDKQLWYIDEEIKIVSVL